jgi:hypothetical protein
MPFTLSVAGMVFPEPSGIWLDRLAGAPYGTPDALENGRQAIRWSPARMRIGRRPLRMGPAVSRSRHVVRLRRPTDGAAEPGIPFDLSRDDRIACAPEGGYSS